MSSNRLYRLRMRRGGADWRHTVRTFSTLERALSAARSAAEYDSGFTRYRVEFEDIDQIVAWGDIRRADGRVALAPITGGAS